MCQAVVVVASGFPRAQAAEAWRSEVQREQLLAMFLLMCPTRQLGSQDRSDSSGGVGSFMVLGLEQVHPSEGMHNPFFGAEIQPKHLVFCYLGFLPGFLLVFCCLPHLMHSRFLENQTFLFWRIFSLVFLNPSNCLVSLELFTCCNKEQMEILLFIYIFSKLQKKRY